MEKRNWKITAKDMAMIGVMVAVIEVCKVTLLALPNIELTTFWIILFTLYFGKLVIFVIPVFILVEGLLYGFGLWWVMYAYLWPGLALLTYILRKMDSAWKWSTLSGFFGLFYGAFCAIPYVVIGAADGGLQSGLYAGFTWWVAGIPWDIVHGVGNMVLMLVLYRPVRAIMEKTKGMVLSVK